MAQCSLNYAADWADTLPYAGELADWASFQDATGNWYEKLPELYKRGSRSGTVMHCPLATAVLQPRWYYVDRSDFDFTANYNLVMRKTGGTWNCMGPRVKHLTSQLSWYSDCSAGTYSGMYYAGPWGNVSAAWMFATNLPFAGQGHGGSAANIIFGDGHVECLTKAMIDARATGDHFWPPSPYCDFYGWAKP